MAAKFIIEKIGLPQKRKNKKENGTPTVSEDVASNYWQTRHALLQKENAALLAALKYTVDWFEKAIKGNIMDAPDAGLVIRKSKQAIARAEQKGQSHE